MENRNQASKQFDKLNIFCTFPVRAVRMKILRDHGMFESEEFCTVIIPAVDVYVTEKAMLKKGFLKRDALSYFVSGTHKAFPYGHVYDQSGYVCLGSIFVPSAVPERSAAMPIETLFLHNDRNLSHGGSFLYIDEDMEKDIMTFLASKKISMLDLSLRARDVRPKVNIISCDGIWNLSADIVELKPLPEALSIMETIFAIIFREEKKKEEEKKQKEQEEAENGGQPQEQETETEE